MSCEDWGWTVEGDQVTPVMTDKPPDPASVLQIDATISLIVDLDSAVLAVMA